MKIDRPNGDPPLPVTRPTEPSQVAGAQSTVSAFDAVLRQHRRREANREGADRRDGNNKPRKDSKSDAATTGSDSQTSTPSALGTLSTAWVESADIRRAQAMPSQVEPTPAQAAAASSNDVRRKRPGDEADSAPCIEVVHPTTGARFLLSQTDGVWLLSVPAQYALEPSSIETLRSQFEECGLGPVDIIIV
jgi:hypothetical protein